MDLLQAMEVRHSVRSYLDRPIEGIVKNDLSAFLERCNRESGLHLQLILDEPTAFDSTLAHYGKFCNVRNYIAVVGPKGPALAETCGYYGEKVVLYAQALGLNTCWVALTYRKPKGIILVEPGETLYLVIATGYGATQGAPHRSKPRERVMHSVTSPPDWFLRGIDAALLAPTAMNQQKFRFSLSRDVVTAKAGIGFYTGVDLGIAKYHFELGAGPEHFHWSEPI